MKKLLFAATLCITTLVAQAQTSNSNPYYSFIQQQTTRPFDYVTQKIMEYNVVSLGEDHWIKDHMEFLTSYLDYIADDTTFHVDALAWESGPINEFSIPHLEPKMFDDTFVERISKRTNGEVKTRNDVFQYIKKGHPTLAEETDKYIE